MIRFSSGKILTLLFVFGMLPIGAEARQKTNPVLEKTKALINEAMTQPPVDFEVCFSPDEGCDIKLVKFIQSAKKSLDIAIFDLTHDQIAHEILVASKRVPVRVVVDRRQAKTDHSLVKLLLKGGVPVKYGYQRGIMHNKFTIVDGARIETGSFNYSIGASAKNNENQIYIGLPEVVDRYKKRFEYLWSEAKKPESK